MPYNAIFTVDEICIPHSWHSIEKDISDKIFIHALDTGSRARFSIVIVIPLGNYNGDLLKTTLQSSKKQPLRLVVSLLIMIPLPSVSQSK